MKASIDGVEVVAQTTALSEAFVVCPENGGVDPGGIGPQGDRRTWRSSEQGEVSGKSVDAGCGSAESEGIVDPRSAAGTANGEVAVDLSSAIAARNSWGLNREARVTSCVGASWRERVELEEPESAGGGTKYEGGQGMDIWRWTVWVRRPATSRWGDDEVGQAKLTNRPLGPNGWCGVETEVACWCREECPPDFRHAGEATEPDVVGMAADPEEGCGKCDE